MPSTTAIRSFATYPRICEYRISAVIPGSLAKSPRTDVALRICTAATIQITITIFLLNPTRQVRPPRGPPIAVAKSAEDTTTDVPLRHVRFFAIKYYPRHARSSLDLPP